MGETLRWWGRSLAEMLLYMLALAALEVPFALLLPPMWRPLPAALIWLASSAYVAGRPRELIGGWGIICATVPPFVVAFGLADYLTLLGGRYAYGVSAAEVPRHANVQGFEFGDAVLRADYAATFRSVSRDRKSGNTTYTHYHVAPLTTAGWTPDDPVPAWVGCSKQYSITCDEWSRPYRAAVVVPATDLAGLRRAVAVALEEHRLRQADGAPVLELAASLRDAQQSRALLMLLPTAFAYLLWAVPVSAAVLWQMLTDGYRQWRGR